MSQVVSFLGLQSSIEALASNKSAMSVSNVQYVDSNNAVTTDLAVPVGGRFLLNGTDFSPGGGFVFFTYQATQEESSAPAIYLSNTQLLVEYVPDMGTDTKSLTPVVFGGGGLAVSSGKLQYDGLFRFDGTISPIAWNGDAFSYDLNTLLQGGSSNVVYPSLTANGITTSTSGTISGNITMANSTTTDTTQPLTIYDNEKQMRASASFAVVTIGGNYTLFNKGDKTDQAGSVFVDTKSTVVPTVGLFDNADVPNMYSKLSPNPLGGLRLTGSLENKRIISIAGFDSSRAVFAITEDNHVHAKGSQTVFVSSVWDGTSGSLGLGDVELELSDFIDFTDTYGWPLAKSIASNVAGTGFILLTKDGKLEVWGTHVYTTSYYTYYYNGSSYGGYYYYRYGPTPSAVQSYVSGNTTYQKAVKRCPISSHPPDQMIGMVCASNTTLAWSVSGVYLTGFAGSNNYSGTTPVYHNARSYSGTFSRITNDGYTSYVESIRNKVIQDCCMTSSSNWVHILILTTDGTLHTRYTRFYTQDSNNYDTYSATSSPFMANGQQGVNYIVQNTGSALNGRTFTKIDCGLYHFAALATNGDFVTWGYGTSGQCGVNSTTGSYATVINSQGSLGGKQVSDFVCTIYGTLMKDVDGRLHFCGGVPTGLQGVLGTANLLVPTLVPISN